MNNLKKYNSFLESIFGFGKKEIPYFYSTRFRMILKAIAASGDSIALKLVYAENLSQITDDITFIDIGSTESVVSFIQLNRLSKIAELETGNTTSKIEDIIRGRWGSSMDNLNSKGWTDQRTEISVGRFVNRVFQKTKVTPSSEQVEKFVNLYKSRIKMASNIDDAFEIVNGEDIRKWYLGDNYISMGRGHLSNSCMRYHRCQEYLDIYVKNTDVCQLLIMKDNNNKLLGRALIWKLTDGNYYMDRQYSNADADIELYREYARKNGWSYHGDRKTNELTVQLGNFDYDYFPYMDSFVVYNYKSHILSTDEDHWGVSDNGWWKLQDTKGGHTSDRVVYSEYNDEYLPVDDAVYCEDISDWVRQDQAIYVEYKDRWYSSESDLVCWSDYHSEYLLMEDAIFSDYMQDWLRPEDVISCYVSSTEEVEIPSDNADITKEVNIDGDNKVCLTNSIMLDPFTNKWVFKKDKIKLYYCNQNDSYISEDDINELEVDRNNTKLETQSNYIISKIGIVDMEDRRTLIKYLHKLELNDNIREKIEKYSLPIKPLDISFNLIKLAIILLPNDSRRGDYFKYQISYFGYESFIEENTQLFLEFIDKETFNKISHSKNIWFSYSSFVDKFLYEIVTDKYILKIYTALKFT